MVETGLPGRPSTRARSLAANISGFPGRMAMRQKSMAKPCALSAACTRSWSPTEAPPRVTSRSCWAPAAMRSCDQLGVVAGDVEQGRARRPRRAPGRRRRCRRRRRSGCGRPARPASPARRRSTGWRRAAFDAPTATAGSSPRPAPRRAWSACGPRRTGPSPAVKSSPALRMWRPMRGASRMVIWAPSALVSSWMTIASAPIGSGAPVKMRTASPGLQRVIVGAAGRRLADQCQRRRHARGHPRRARRSRPSPRGRPAAGSGAPEAAAASTRPARLGHRHRLGRQSVEGRDHAGMGVANGEHQSASALAKCPATCRPTCGSSRTSEITMPRSTDLHMS